jgi:PAS domain S-box-containing protein
MTILDGIEDAVVKLDGHANCVAMNQAAADTIRRLGQDPQRMIGKSVWELVPEVRGTVVERQLRQTLEDDASIKFEFLHPGDQRSYETQGYPSSPGAILVFRDITDRKAAS